jgi:hypothetical protein
MAFLRVADRQGRGKVRWQQSVCAKWKLTAARHLCMIVRRACHPLMFDVPSTFRKIGVFEIVVDGDVVNLWSSPEFNLEAALEYAGAMETIIERMPSVFGVMTRFESPPIIGPDVEASLKETAKRRAQRGMVAVAFVIPNADHGGMSIAIAQWHRIYDPINVAFAVFSEVETARPWLREKIDSARK